MPDPRKSPETAQLVFLDHTDCIGGAQLSMKSLAAHLRKTSFPVQELIPSPLKWFPFSVQKSPSGLFAMAVNSLYCLFRFLLQDRPSWYCNSVLDRLQCALIPRRFVITHVRDIPLWWHLWVMNALPSRGYVVSSEFMKMKMMSLAPFAVPVHVVPNIVQVIRRLPCESGKREMPAMDPFRVLMVANLVPWKNHGIAVEAVKSLGSRGIPIVLDIWGGDPLGENRDYANRIRRMVEALSLGSIRLIEGKRIHAEDYSRYHCLLHTAEEEPFGRVLVEAWLSGLPVLGHGSGCTVDLIKKYGGGITYRLNRSDVVVDALIRLRNDYGHYRREVLNSMVRISRDFSGERALEEFERNNIFPEMAGYG